MSACHPSILVASNKLYELLSRAQVICGSWCWFDNNNDDDYYYSYARFTLIVHLFLYITEVQMHHSLVDCIHVIYSVYDRRADSNALALVVLYLIAIFICYEGHSFINYSFFCENHCLFFLFWDNVHEIKLSKSSSSRSWQAYPFHFVRMYLKKEW